MNDTIKIKRVAFRPPRVHGHVKLDLFDAATGRRVKTVERDNYVTAALQQLTDVLAGGSGDLSLAMPVATKALGGIMLFNNPLGDDPTVIGFPTASQLVGYALRETNTTNALRGSLISEGPTSGGYSSTWEFGPNQANGIIRAVSLTNSEVDPLTGFSTGGRLPRDTEGNALQQGDVVIDYVDGVLYYAGLDSTATGLSGTITLKIYSERFPLGAYKVADAQGALENAELLQTLTVSLPLQSGDRINYVGYADGFDPQLYYAGKDGSGRPWFFYCAYGNAYGYTDYVLYFNLERGAGGTYHVGTSGRFTVTGERPLIGGSVSGNYGYFLGLTSGSLTQHRKLLQVSLSTFSDVHSYTLPEPYYFAQYEYNQFAIAPAGGGALYVSVYKASASSGYYDYHRGYFSPDGGFLIDPAPYATRNRVSSGGNVYFYRDTGALWAWNVRSGGSGFIAPGAAQITGYLGTVANLEQAVTKTANQTLRVTYTLTDE